MKKKLSIEIASICVDCFRNSEIRLLKAVNSVVDTDAKLPG